MTSPDRGGGPPRSSRAATPARRTALLVVAVTIALTPTPAEARLAVVDRGRELPVADRCEGSSNPTFYPSNRRLVRTPKGRLLAIYDAEGAGQQITWRDPGGRWRKRTRGAVDDGMLPGAGPDDSSDRPGSIALARDRAHRQHAWIVTSGSSFAKGERLAVMLWRLSELNDSAGPRVGRPVTVSAAGRGNVRADVAFEPIGRRRARGVVSWLERTGDRRFELQTAWFTRLGADQPPIRARRTLATSGHRTPTATLVPVKRGIRVVTTTGGGRLRFFSHRSRTRLGRWSASPRAVPVSRRGKPSGVHLGSGHVLAALDSDPRADAVKVVRFGRPGRRPKTVLSLRGHRQPVLTRRRRSAWLVSVRARDGVVVSRRFRRDSGWGRQRVEIAVADEVKAPWPSLPTRTRGRLRLLFAGAQCPRTPKAHSVMMYSRRAR